jgi:D-sedoheptulose 7-phosphate isomerase
MLGATLDAAGYLKRLNAEVERIDQSALTRWADLIYEAWEQDRFVFIFGNGGSGLSASHMSQDFGKSTLHEHDLHDDSKKRLKVLSLTDNVGWLMAIGNDLDYDQIFLQQLKNYASEGDVAIGISASGNSQNVLNAIEWSNRSGLKTFGLSGYDGGQLKTLQQDGVHVELDDVGMVEGLHLCLFHWALNDVFARINQEGRYAQP